MTRAADLLIAIDSGDAEACAALLADLEERARRALHPAVALRTEELEAGLRDFSNQSRGKIYKSYTVARLALLGVATLGELKRSSVWSFSGHEKTAALALANRRPDWLAEWSEFELARSFRNWPVVRTLVRGGSIPGPSTAFYILGMIAAPNRHTSPRHLLEQDPTLVNDELWRLFEHEGSGELSLAAYDKYVPDSRSWLQAFVEMAAEGSLDRARILTATLDALQRDFAPFRAGWFSRLHEALKPTKEERAERSHRYLDLLTSRVPATVAFAMKALTAVDKAGGLDTVKELDRLAPAFEARDKGTVERALVMAGKAAKKCDAATKVRLSALAARALAHESPDIQAKALELVGRDESLISPYLDLLAPSVRTQWKVSEPATTLTHPLQAVAMVGTELRIVPINNLSELVEAFSAVLENQGPPAEIERVIDGVARIGIAASGQVDFGRLTGGLAKRAQKFISAGVELQPRAALTALALAWTLGKQTVPPRSEKHLADFLIWRLWCASEQTAMRINQPLLSLPTSPDGRIEPAEFDQRLAALTDAQRKAAENDRESLFHLDFRLAQLRATECAYPIRTRLVWTKRTWEADGRTYSHYQPRLETEGLSTPSRFDPAGLTTAQIRSTVEMKRWCATVCPHWREGWFAAGCREIGANLDWWEAQWSTRAYLEPLLNPHTPVGSMGALLIALGLGAKEPGESGLATDALIALTADSRVDATALGRALIEAAASGAIKIARWAKQLQKAAQAGPTQAEAIFLAIEALLESGQGAQAGDFGRLVELEHELAHLTDLRLNRPGALRTLESLSTGGKTRKAAKGLLTLGTLGRDPSAV